MELVRAVVALALALAACTPVAPSDSGEGPAVAPAATCSGADRASQATAQVVAAENRTSMTVASSLAPSSETDWYSYEADAAGLSQIDPRIEVAFDSDVDFEVCVYMYCGTLTCPAGTTPAVAPGGQTGCCSTTVSDWQIFGCGLDYTTVWMSVQVTETTDCNACVGYTVDYNW